MTDELRLINKLMGFSSPEKVPVGFSFDEIYMKGFPEETCPSVKRNISDSGIVTTEISAIPAKGVILTARETAYRDFPVIEWGADVLNRGKKDSELLSDFSVCGVLEGNNPRLISGSGDTRNQELFKRSEEIKITERISVSPNFCRGADGASPFMLLHFDEYSLIFAIGWPGKWRITFEPTEGGIKYSLCQADFCTRLHPLEAMRTPNLTVLAWKGEDSKGINLWRKFYLKHILPTGKNGEKVKPLMFLHTHMIGGYGEFEGITTENQIEGIDNYIKRGLKPDCWWIDAGWYPCEHNWWNVGDWTPNPDQLPDGFRPIAEHLHKRGSELLVWFEPERVMRGSRLDYLHPEWCLKAHNEKGEEEECRLLDYSNPQCFDFVLKLLDAHIKTGGIDIYRQDFNFTPDKYFEENDGEDRRGATENLHMQALIRLYDELRIRNPGLIIDNCAAGGTRNEMDLMRRSVPLQYTDMHIDDPSSRIFHYYEMFSFIPYFRAHAKRYDKYKTKNRSTDEYAYQCAMAPAITVCHDWDDNENCYNTARKMLPIWRKMAEYELSSDFYRLTSPESGWYGVQFHNEEDNSGFIQVIRTENAKDSHINVYPHIIPNSRYVFRNPVNNDIKRGDSAGLDGGFTFYNAAQRGEIWFYTVVPKDNI